MNRDDLLALLSAVKEGSLAPAQAAEALKDLPFRDLGFAKVDNHRALRTGHPEVIFCPGKTDEQILRIAGIINENNNNVLATRAGAPTFDRIKEVFPGAQYYADARIVFIGKHPVPSSQGFILVVSGGTSDVPVAEEAAITAEKLGNRVERLYDVGVAGIHRLLKHIDLLRAASVLIVVAGMEGALPSVVGGLVDGPVVAVPTSIGYGANFQGLAALLTMLNSCAAGIGVVNIDNGFGAGYLAASINRRIETARGTGEAASPVLGKTEGKQ